MKCHICNAPLELTPEFKGFYTRPCECRFTKFHCAHPRTAWIKVCKHLHYGGEAVDNDCMIGHGRYMCTVCESQGKDRFAACTHRKTEPKTFTTFWCTKCEVER